MADLGNITISIKAETKKFKGDIKKAEQATKKFANNGKKSISSFAKSAKTNLMSVAQTIKGPLIAAMTAATVAIGAMTKDMLNQTRELSVWSQTLGMSTQRLQEFQIAAQSVGFGTEKVTDIFKDVNDKLGDFLATGGGEAKDIFEKLAIDAQKLKGVGADKVLEQIVAKMDEMKLGREERIFLLEALANDASKLLPLLENNAAKLKELRETARKSGAILSDKDVKQFERYNKSVNKLKANWLGVKNTIVTKVIPPILEGINKIVDAWKVAFGIAESIALRVTGLFGDSQAEKAMKTYQQLADSEANAKIRQSQKLRQEIEVMLRTGKDPREKKGFVGFGSGLKEASEKLAEAAAEQKVAARKQMEAVTRSQTAIGQMLNQGAQGELSRIVNPLAQQQARSGEFDRISKNIVMAIQQGSTDNRFFNSMFQQLEGIKKVQDNIGGKSTTGMGYVIKELQQFLKAKADKGMKVDVTVDVKPSKEFDVMIDKKIQQVNKASLSGEAAMVGR